MPAITTTISTLPTAPNSATMTATAFSAAAIAHVASLSTLVAEFNTLIGQMNSAAASINFAGSWSTLTGSLSVPATVEHNGTMYLLLQNIANVTTQTPGAAPTYWQPIGTIIPQNIKSAAYTTVLADAGKHILHPAADTTARVFTIAANSSVAYPIGTAITFVNENAAGVITIAITTDTMRLAGAGTTGSRTLAANGVATALKITSTSWIISGTGLS